MTNPTTPASASVQTEPLRQALVDIWLHAESLEQAMSMAREALSQPAASQEAIYWVASLDPAQRPQMLNESMHVVGIRKKKTGEQFVAEQLDFYGWRYTLEPLYTHPQQPSATGGDGWALAKAQDSSDYSRPEPNDEFKAPASQPTSGAAGDADSDLIKRVAALREPFEAWATEQGYTLAFEDRGYMQTYRFTETEHAWRGYCRASLATPPAQHAEQPDAKRYWAALGDDVEAYDDALAKDSSDLHSDLDFITAMNAARSLVSQGKPPAQADKAAAQPDYDKLMDAEGIAPGRPDERFASLVSRYRDAGHGQAAAQQGVAWGWAIIDKHGVAQAIRPRIKEFFGAIQPQEPFTQEDVKKMDREWPGLVPHCLVTLYTTPQLSETQGRRQMTDDEFISAMDSSGLGPVDPGLALDIKELVESWHGIPASPQDGGVKC